MKQFINIEGSHYSVDGILAIHNVRKPASETVPELLGDVVQYLNDMEEGGHRIASLKFVNLSTQYALEIVHMGEGESLYYLIPQKFVRTEDDAIAVQQFVVEQIACSNEPVIEMNEIMDRFATAGTYRGKPINSIDDE